MVFCFYHGVGLFGHRLGTASKEGVQGALLQALEDPSICCFSAFFFVLHFKGGNMGQNRSAESVFMAEISGPNLYIQIVNLQR